MGVRKNRPVPVVGHTLGHDIIDLVKRAGPQHVRAICQALGRDYMDVNPAITGCTRRGLLVIICTAEEAGFTDVRRDAPVYGVPGQGREDVAPAPKQSHTAKRATSNGSGQIAGPRTIPAYKF